MGNFIWFVITLMVTLSNILLSVFLYYELQMLKSKNKRMKELKDICMYYATGMMIALILAIALFGVTNPLL